MKRLLSFILTVTVMFSLWACGKSSEDFQIPVKFYYTYSYFYSEDRIAFDSSDGSIAFETRESKNYGSDLQELLDLYLQGPISDELQSPFPSNVHVESLATDRNTLLITLSPEFAKLTGFDLTIACACLSLTALDLVECETVSIHVPDTLLDGNNSITMSKDTLLLLDAVSIQEDAS